MGRCVGHGRPTGGLMSKLSEYQDKYETARFERSDDGILQVTLHADGGPWQMGRVSHDEMPEIFRDVAEDLENVVLILAGTGDEWSGPLGYDVPFPRNETQQWEYIHWV